MAKKISRALVKKQDTAGQKAETVEHLAKRVAKGGGIAFFGSIIGKVSNLFLQILLTRVLGVSYYGLYALGFSVVNIATQFSSLGLQSGIVRFGALYKGGADKGGVKGTFLSALIISLISSASVGILLSALSSFISVTFFKEPGLANILTLFAVSLPFYTLMLMTSASARALQEMKYAIGVQNIFQPITNVAIVGITFLLGFRLLGAVGGFVGSAFLSAILGIYFLKRIFPEIISGLKPHFEYKSLLRFSVPVFLASFSFILVNQVDRIMLGYFSSLNEVGVYNAAAQIALQTNLFFISLNFIFAPLIADLYNKNKLGELERLTNTVIRWNLSLTLPVTLILTLFSREIMGIFGSGFVVGQSVLIALVLSRLIFLSTGPVESILLMSGKQDLILVNNIALAGINIVLNIWFIKKYEALGAAMATGLSIVILAIVLLIELTLFLKMTPFKKECLNPLIAGLSGVVSWYIFNGTVGLGGLNWIASMTCFLLVYSITLLFMGIDEEDKLIMKAVRGKLLNIGRK